MAKLRVVVDSLNEFIDKIMAALALEVIKNLVAAPSEGGTPIDTGWASANWIPYVGTAPNDPDGERPTGTGVASRTKQQSNSNALVNYDREKGDIIIANNVPYIVSLNDGNSAQAGSAFVQKAIAKAVQGVATV